MELQLNSWLSTRRTNACAGPIRSFSSYGKRPENDTTKPRARRCVHHLLNLFHAVCEALADLSQLRGRSGCVDSGEGRCAALEAWQPAGLKDPKELLQRPTNPLFTWIEGPVPPAPPGNEA